MWLVVNPILAGHIIIKRDQVTEIRDFVYSSEFTFQMAELKIHHVQFW